MEKQFKTYLHNKSKHDLYRVKNDLSNIPHR